MLSCEGQAALGHEVHLAFGPIYGPEGSLLDRVRAFRAPNGRAIQVHVLPNLVREIAPMKDSYCARELRGFLTVLRPDIVHTHSSKAGILGREAAWRVNAHQRAFDRKYPGGEFRQMGVVHTIHGPPFMPIEGGLGKRLKVRLLNMAYTLAEKRAAHHCHVLVSVADAMTREFLRRGIGRAEQYITVRSGMETRAFLDAGPAKNARMRGGGWASATMRSSSARWRDSRSTRGTTTCSMRWRTTCGSPMGRCCCGWAMGGGARDWPSGRGGWAFRCARRTSRTALGGPGAPRWSSPAWCRRSRCR